MSEIRIINSKERCDSCQCAVFTYCGDKFGPDKDGNYYLCPDIVCTECGEELE